MAIVKYPAGSLGAMQEGEQRLVKYLETHLPDCHYLIPNLSLTSTNRRNNQVQVVEYDLIVYLPMPFSISKTKTGPVGSKETTAIGT